MRKTVEEHRAENEPDIVRLAEVMLPLAWQHDGGSNVREASLRMAERVREQFKIERGIADHMVWEMGAMHARAEAERQRVERESSARYLLGRLFRVLTWRAEKAIPACPHLMLWDECPDCSH